MLLANIRDQCKRRRYGKHIRKTGELVQSIKCTKKNIFVQCHRRIIIKQKNASNPYSDKVQ